MSISTDLSMALIKEITGKRADRLNRFILACLDCFQPRRDIILKNLSVMFPDMPQKEKENLLHKHYKNIVLTITELCGWQADLSRINSWTEVEGKEYIDTELEKGKGVLFLTAHFGNWEHAAAWIGANYGSYGIAQYGKFQYERDLTNLLRERTGLHVIEKNESMMKVRTILKKNGTVGIVSDQFDHDGMKVPFFGMNTKTAVGIALFSYLTGASIIPGFSIRTKPYRFKMKFFPPLQWEKLSTRDETVFEIAKKMNKLLENVIKSAPEQWFLMHKRFKDVIDY